MPQLIIFGACVMSSPSLILGLIGNILVELFFSVNSFNVFCLN